MKANQLINKFYIFFPLFFLYSSFFANAQSLPFQWGRVSNKEINYKDCEYEKEASAIILAEFGEVSFNFGAEAYIKIHRRIKILSEKGIEQADVRIPFYTAGAMERVSQLRAHTINLNQNKKEEYSKVNEIFETQVDKDWAEKRFTFPKVEVGSILEYSYTLATKNLSFLEGWTFQKSIPVLYSEFRASIPEGLDYRILYQGSRLIKKYGEGAHRQWILENLPAITAEPFSMGHKDFIEKIRFQLAGYLGSGGAYNTTSYVSTMHTWEKLTEELLTHHTFNQYLSRHQRGKALLNQIVNDKDSSFVKIKKIYYYVLNELNWDGEYSFIPSKNISDLLASKTGNSADLNLLLVLLLNEVDADAFPVLLSTTSHGMVMKDYPFITQFNHVITYIKVGEKEFYLDAIDPFLPFNTLPVEDLVEEGFVLDRKNPRWIAISNKVRSGIAVSGRVNPFSQEKPFYHFQVDWFGLEAAKARKDLRNENQAAIKEYFNLNITGLDLDSVSLENVTDVEKPLKANFNFGYEEKSAATQIYLEPIYLGAMMDNPFKDDTRQFPIDFGFPFTNHILMTIYYPNTYIVESSPKNLVLRMPDNYGEFSFQMAILDNKIQIAAKTAIYKKIIPSLEYPSLKQFFDLMIKKLKEPIVFKKMQ